MYSAISSSLNSQFGSMTSSLSSIFISILTLAVPVYFGVRLAFASIKWIGRMLFGNRAYINGVYNAKKGADADYNVWSKMGEDNFLKNELRKKYAGIDGRFK